MARSAGPLKLSFMRKKIVAGNWKMNKTLPEAVELTEKIIDLSFTDTPKDVTLIIAPPFVYLTRLSVMLAEHGRIYASAQNCASAASGAYTGEVAASMIASTGAEYVIIGHSERRSYYAEDDATLAKKVDLALDAGLKVIFCCGEQKQERESGNEESVVSAQIEKALFHLSEEALKNVVIAYEPVWAIGTGLTATPEQAQNMHAYIRKIVAEKYSDELAESTSILYGGSCNDSNAAELFAKEDIDGGLIGGASLVAEKFVAISRSFPK